MWRTAEKERRRKRGLEAERAPPPPPTHTGQLEVIKGCDLGQKAAKSDLCEPMY